MPVTDQTFCCLVYPVMKYHKYWWKIIHTADWSYILMKVHTCWWLIISINKRSSIYWRRTIHFSDSLHTLVPKSQGHDRETIYSLNKPKIKVTDLTSDISIICTSDWAYMLVTKHTFYMQVVHTVDMLSIHMTDHTCWWRIKYLWQIIRTGDRSYKLMTD